MTNPLFCHRHLHSNPKWCACIEVPVVFWEGTGTDLQANAMIGFEHLTGVPALEGQRSIKDVLAHIADWKRRCVSWIEAGLQGKTPDRPETGYAWSDIDRLNDRTFVENRNHPLSEVLAELHEAYQQLLAPV